MYWYVQKIPGYNTALFQQKRVQLSKEKKIKKNLKPEMSKTVKSNHRINEIMN